MTTFKIEYYHVSGKLINCEVRSLHKNEIDNFWNDVNGMATTCKVDSLTVQGQKVASMAILEVKKCTFNELQEESLA